MSEYDSTFSLPSLDADPATELGVLLMGLGPERLLAGLGVAAGTDPATVTLLVDQLRHDARPDLTMAAAVTAGASRWRAARCGLEAADPGGVRSAALRRRWAAALATVTTAAPLLEPAERVYLAACWLRRTEIDALVETDDVVSELPS